MRLKLKQIIRFVDTMDTVEYNAKKKRISLAIKLSKKW